MDFYENQKYLIEIPIKIIIIIILKNEIISHLIRNTAI